MNGEGRLEGMMNEISLSGAMRNPGGGLKVLKPTQHKVDFRKLDECKNSLIEIGDLELHGKYGAIIKLML